MPIFPRTVHNADMAAPAPGSGAGARGRGRGRGGGAGRGRGRGGAGGQGQGQSLGGQGAHLAQAFSNHTGASTPVVASTDPTPAGTPPPPTVSTYLSTTTFSSLSSQVDARLLGAVPFEFMSEVQAATIQPALRGVDVLAQAKTGTGKTVAFLLPAINKILSRPGPGPAPPKGKVSCLILSPTRELALQIEKEAKMLLANLGGAVGVQHVVGGTNMNSEQNKLARDRCDILVATPGRLLDHLNHTPGTTDRFSNLSTYVLDEADRMLDMGFRKELEKINAFLPRGNKQSLLFSATIPPGVRQVANLSSDAEFINTLSEEESNTHQHIPQQSIVAPMTDLLPLTLALLLEEFERHSTKAKVIVFSPTARAAALAAEVFRSAPVTSLLSAICKGPFSVGEIHSRKSQGARVSATKTFAEASSAILFSSDVAARGVDFPGVTAVFQVGLPASTEQYIHRIGRTGRAGAVGGRGVLVLADFEAGFMAQREMRELPIAPHPGLSEQKRSISDQTMLAALEATPDEPKAQAYQAALGYYKSELKMLRWSPAELVANMNAYASDALRYKDGQPPLLAKTVGKMGLKGVPGLNIVKELPAKGAAPPRGGGAPRQQQYPAQGGQQGQGRSISRSENGRGQEKKPRVDMPVQGSGGRGRGGAQGQNQRGAARGGRGGRGVAQVQRPVIAGSAPAAAHAAVNDPYGGW